MTVADYILKFEEQYRQGQRNRPDMHDCKMFGSFHVDCTEAEFVVPTAFRFIYNTYDKEFVYPVVIDTEEKVCRNTLQVLKHLAGGVRHGLFAHAVIKGEHYYGGTNLILNSKGNIIFMAALKYIKEAGRLAPIEAVYYVPDNITADDGTMEKAVLRSFIPTIMAGAPRLYGYRIHSIPKKIIIGDCSHFIKRITPPKVTDDIDKIAKEVLIKNIGKLQ